MRLLRWYASSPLDFSVCHEPKRCKRHYTKMLCRVNGKFDLCRDPSGDRKLAGGDDGRRNTSYFGIIIVDCSAPQKLDTQYNDSKSRKGCPMTSHRAPDTQDSLHSPPRLVPRQKWQHPLPKMSSLLPALPGLAAGGPGRACSYLITSGR